MYMIGQACGLISAGITIAMPQFKRKTQMMICSALINALNALNYAFINGIGSAVFLCLVAVVQAIISIWHEKNQTIVTTFETILFFFLYVGFGFLGLVTAEGFVLAINRQNLLELLPIIGALMLMLSIFAKGEQRTRLFLLLNAAAWLVYTALIGSATVFGSAFSLISSAIALWKYRT